MDTKSANSLTAAGIGLPDGNEAENLPKPLNRKLRILQFVEASLAGVGRHVTDLVSELIRRNHEVHLVYSPLRADPKFRAALDTFASDSRVTLVPRRIHRGFRGADIGHIVWLRRYLASKGPFDVIHCHSSKAGLIGRIAGIGSAAKVFYTPNALFTMQPGLPAPIALAAKITEAALARCSDRIIAVSRIEFDHALRIGIGAGKLALLPNGADVAHRAPPSQIRRELRRALNLPDDVVCIGWVGRIVPQKALDHLLSAFVILYRQLGVPVRLLIGGGGSLCSELQRRSGELRLGESVAWLGEVNGQELMCAFDVYALSSAYEGFPYVLIEALAAGLPIVTTDVGGAREMVQDGINGFVVPPCDATALANALARLATDKDLRGTMGRASLERAGVFSAKRMADETQQEYYSLCGAAF